MKIEEIIQKKLQTVFQDESIIFDKSRFAGGLTNYNYIMEIHGTEYVVRQPGGMTNLMIDRRIEKVNSGIASELGLNSECICFDETSGIKISVYIKNSKNFAIADPCSPICLSAVSNILKQTHNSPRVFPNSFDWKTELNNYEKIVEEMNGDLFYDYSALKAELFEYVNKNINHMVSVPCHNDTVPENFLIDDKGKTYLIDWEYSGMNDPSWDVAAYILESRLTSQAIDRLLTEYYGQIPEEEEIRKIMCFMLAQDLLWMVWALIRHYDGDDFLDYCYLRYERFRRNIKAVKNAEGYSLADMVKF